MSRSCPCAANMQQRRHASVTPSLPSSACASVRCIHTSHQRMRLGSHRQARPAAVTGLAVPSGRIVHCAAMRPCSTSAAAPPLSQPGSSRRRRCRGSGLTQRLRPDTAARCIPSERPDASLHHAGSISRSTPCTQQPAQTEDGHSGSRWRSRAGVQLLCSRTCTGSVIQTCAKLGALTA